MTTPRPARGVNERYCQSGAPKHRVKALAILANLRVLTAGLMMFSSVAADLGFVYWLP